MGILLRALALEGAATDTPPPGAGLSIPARSTSAGMSADRALTLPSFLRGTQLLAGMCSGLTIGAYRKDAEVANVALVDKPDTWRSRSAFIERVIVGMILDGNAFLLKHRDALGRVISTEALNPFAVRIWRDRAGRKKYDYVNAAHSVKTYDADDIEHLWYLEAPGHARSLGPIGYARADLAGYLDTRDYAANWFTESGTPASGVLSSDQRVTREIADETKKIWHETADNGVRVIGSNLKYEPFMLKPEEAQWLEAQNFGVTGVARLLGIPAYYLLAQVEGSSMTYTNITVIDTPFLNATLKPNYLRKIEDALTAMLPGRLEARFKTGELIQPDAKTQAEIDAIDIKNKIRSVDEIRSARGYAPREVTPA